MVVRGALLKGEPKGKHSLLGMRQFKVAIALLRATKILLRFIRWK